ncbi:hypothetical protein B566_EDAN012617 [Ephemera danica]|nr:hypothetical protein B566_EDAN012617 [Ephemera danica]
MALRVKRDAIQELIKIDALFEPNVGDVELSDARLFNSRMIMKGNTLASYQASGTKPVSKENLKRAQREIDSEEAQLCNTRAGTPSGPAAASGCIILGTQASKQAKKLRDPQSPSIINVIEIGKVDAVSNFSSSKDILQSNGDVWILILRSVIYISILNYSSGGKVTNCEFVMYTNVKDIPSMFSRFELVKEAGEDNITKNLLTIKESNSLYRLKEVENANLICGENDKQLREIFCKNFTVVLNQDGLEGEMKSILQQSEQHVGDCSKYFREEVRDHFNLPGEGIALSEESDVFVSRENIKSLANVLKQGLTDIIKILHERDRTLLNKQNKDGETPLHLACWNSNSDVLKQLLTFPECQQGHNDKIKFLLDNDITLLNKRDKNGNTPLHMASKYGKSEAVEKLITYPGCQLHEVNNNGEFAIHIASLQGHDDIIKFLLDGDPTLLNKQDKKGSTPLHMASKYGNTEAVKQLITYPGCQIRRYVI